MSLTLNNPDAPSNPNNYNNPDAPSNPNNYNNPNNSNKPNNLNNPNNQYNSDDPHKPNDATAVHLDTFVETRVGPRDSSEVHEGHHRTRVSNVRNYKSY